MSFAPPTTRKLLGAALVVSACGSPPDAAVKSAAMRDSAGVTIIENHTAQADLPEWTLSAKPILELGSLTGSDDYDLLWVNSAFYLSDGRLVVTSGGTHELLFFDGSGQFLHAIGGKGDGPGEYARPYMSWPLSGDSIAVWDSQRRTVTVLDSDGEYVRSISPTAAGFNPDMSAASGGWLDGTFLLHHVEPEFVEGKLAPVYADLLTFDPAGELAASLATIEFGEYKLVDGQTVNLIFGPYPQIAVTEGGLWFGDGKEYEVRFLDQTGSTKRIVRWTGPDRTVQTRHIDRYWQKAMENAASSGERGIERVRDLREIQPVADRFPALAWLRVDSEDNLWVLSYRQFYEEDSRHLWTVFAPDGSISAVLRPPADVRNVFEIGSDYLIALARNELDVEFLRVYRLNRGEPLQATAEEPGV